MGKEKNGMRSENEWRELWLDVAAADNVWAAAELLTREKLASVRLLEAPFSGGTMPVAVYSVELQREVGKVEHIEMRGAELWARLKVEPKALEVPRSHAEGMFAFRPEGMALFAVLLTNKPRGVMSRMLEELMRPA